VGRRAAVFALLLIGLDLGLGTLFARGFARVRSGWSGGLANQAIAVEAPLLILGSSRARHHLDPAILGPAAGLRVWNAGADGQGLYYASSLLHLVERRSVPRVVLWSLDPRDFDARERSGQLQRLSVLLPHYDESSRLRSLWRSQGHAARWKVHVRTYRFNSLVLPMLARLLQSSPPPSHGGFDPMPARPGSLEQELTQDYEEPDSRASEALEEALEEVTARGCEVILLTGPTWTAGEPPARFYERIDRPLEDLARRIPRVRFWRLDEIVLPEFRDPGLYVDAGHLNAAGAARFSTLVAERLRSEIRPLLSDGSP